jgi:hypothetical protein
MGKASERWAIVGAGTSWGSSWNRDPFDVDRSGVASPGRPSTPAMVVLLVFATGAIVSDDPKVPRPVSRSSSGYSPIPPDERVEPPPTIEELVRGGFASMQGTLSTLSHDVREVRYAQHESNQRIGRLEAHVFGSKPPPELEGGPVVKMPPLIARTSLAEADVDALQGGLLATRSELAEVRGELAEVKQQNAQQNKAQGIAPAEASTRRKVIAFVFSREGAKAVVSILGAVSAVLAAASTAPACGARAPAGAPAAVTAPAPAR